jgi:hypothetical protein
MFNGSELVENPGGRLGAIVEDEHNPEINEQAVLRSQNNGCLVIRVLVDKVAQRCEELGSFVGCEDVVATPDLVVLRVSLHGVCSHDSEVVTSAFQACKEVFRMLEVIPI